MQRENSSTWRLSNPLLLSPEMTLSIQQQRLLGASVCCALCCLIVRLMYRPQIGINRTTSLSTVAIIELFIVSFPSFFF